jgi:hypothetical protein
MSLKLKDISCPICGLVSYHEHVVNEPRIWAEEQNIFMPREYPAPEIAMDLMQDNIHIDLPGHRSIKAARRESI